MSVGKDQRGPFLRYPWSPMQKDQQASATIYWRGGDRESKPWKVWSMNFDAVVKGLCFFLTTRYLATKSAGTREELKSRGDLKTEVNAVNKVALPLFGVSGLLALRIGAHEWPREKPMPKHPLSQLPSVVRCSSGS